jgi:aryl carrier-like protein
VSSVSSVVQSSSTAEASLPNAGIDPEDLWALGDALAYEVEICWSRDVPAGAYDVVFRDRHARREGGSYADASQQRDRDRSSSSPRWQDYANDPLRDLRTRQLATVLRAYLKDQLPEYMVPALFVLLDAEPITPSGKADRRALPAPLPALEPDDAFVAPRTPVEAALAHIWAEVLGLERMGIRQNFFAAGGDSIRGIQVVARAREMGLHLTPKHLFQHQTIAELAEVTAPLAAPVPAQTGLMPAAGPVPLTPSQRRFFAQRLPDPNGVCEICVLAAPPDLDAAQLEQTVFHLLARHDALRLRFVRVPASPTSGDGASQDAAGGHGQWTAAHLAASVDATGVFGHSEHLGADVVLAAQAALDLEQGPLLRVVLVARGAQGPKQLLIAAHQAVIDQVSWRILLHDLAIAYEQLSRGEPVRLAAPAGSFAQWARQLAAYAESTTAAVAGSAGQYWLGAQWDQVSRLPVDHPEAADSQAQAGVVLGALSTAETRALLDEVPVAYHAQVPELLLAALAQTLTAWTGSPALLIELEHDGRTLPFADHDVSRTIGSFAIEYPVLLNLAGANDPGAAVGVVKEQLRRVRNHAIDYGVLRYLCQDEGIVARLRALPRPEVRFTYLGEEHRGLAGRLAVATAPEGLRPQSPPTRAGHAPAARMPGVNDEGLLYQIQLNSDGLISPPRLRGGVGGGVDALRVQEDLVLENGEPIVGQAFHQVEAFANPASQGYRLDIRASVAQGQLCLEWLYDERAYHRATIEDLARRCIMALSALIARGQSAASDRPQGATLLDALVPSDFPLASLDRSQLRVIAAKAGHGLIEDIYPLAPMQDHMLVRTLAAPEPGLYLVYQSFLIHGIQPDAFARAWQCVFDRHPVLRTSFVWEGLREPLQVVHARVPVPLERQDWRGLAPDEQEARLAAYAQAIRQRSFDLTRAPQSRIALFQVAEDAYHFYWGFSYLLQDGWSFPLIAREFFAFYRAFCQGQEIELERPRPYRDYIAWYRRQDLGKAERFWRQALEGFTAPTPLVRSVAGGELPQEEGYVHENLDLPIATTTALRAMARQHQLTVNTLLQGAWALLLSRYTDMDDVIFGGIVSGRPAELPGVETMVGSFNNLLPIRVQIAPQMLLLAWLRDLQAQQAELRQYEYSPPRKIRAWSAVPGDGPLFESYLVFENFPMDAAVPEGFTRWDTRYGQGATQTEHPLRVQVWPLRTLLISMSYQRRYFTAATVARMLADLQAMLEAFVAHPRAAVGELLT